jgi:hypothetical protein
LKIFSLFTKEALFKGNFLHLESVINYILKNNPQKELLNIQFSNLDNELLVYSNGIIIYVIINNEIINNEIIE